VHVGGNPAPTATHPHTRTHRHPLWLPQNEKTLLFLDDGGPISLQDWTESGGASARQSYELANELHGGQLYDFCGVETCFHTYTLPKCGFVYRYMLLQLLVVCFYA